jgi:hypothetical protein
MSTKKRIVTAMGYNDGFGAQYHAKMTAVAYAMFKNYIYRHVPMKSVAHHSGLMLDDRSEIASIMDKFTGLKSDIDDNLEYPINDSPRFIPEVTFARKPDIYYTKLVRNHLRGLYYSTEKPTPNIYDVAIHIRRGDVTQSPLKNPRYTPNSFYIKLIHKLKKINPNYTIGIYSEGQLSDFEELHGENIDFNLNGDIRNAFHDLVNSKILVISKSSFSFCAGILSTGNIYSIPFQHAAVHSLNDWIVVEED